MVHDMGATFSFGTRISLFYTAWTAKTSASYAAILLFVFGLTIFRQSLKVYQSRRKRNHAINTRTPLHITQEFRWKAFSRRIGSLFTPWKYSAALMRRSDSFVEEMIPLSPLPTQPSPPLWREQNSALEPELRIQGLRIIGFVGGSDDAHDWNKNGSRSFWSNPNPTLSWCVEVERVAIEMLGIAIGYILMLAVMTYNVGIFLAALSGVLIGELVFGRYPTAVGSDCHG